MPYNSWMPNKFKYICYFCLQKVNLREGESTALLLFSKMFLKQFFLLIALCDHVGKLEFKTFKKPSNFQNKPSKVKLYLFTLFTLIIHFLKNSNTQAHVVAITVTNTAQNTSKIFYIIIVTITNSCHSQFNTSISNA